MWGSLTSSKRLRPQPPHLGHPQAAPSRRKIPGCARSRVGRVARGVLVTSSSGGQSPSLSPAEKPHPRSLIQQVPQHRTAPPEGAPH